MRLSKKMEDTVWLLLRINYVIIPLYGGLGIQLGGANLKTEKLFEILEMADKIEIRMVRLTYYRLLTNLIAMSYKKRQRVIDYAYWLTKALDKNKFIAYCEDKRENGGKKKIKELLND